MSAKTLTKTELITAVAEKTGLTYSAAQESVDTVLEVMQGAFKSGRKVEFRNFGIFQVSRRAERQGRNPANAGAGPITIPAKNVVKFRVGAELDKAINTP